MQLEFLRQKSEADEITSFFFKPLQPFEWQAGQSIKLELDTLMGTSERRFTIASAPSEEVFQITTRISDSDFKQKLNSLKPGEKIKACCIEGDFTWRSTNLKPIFIAAGIGVTPFRSILKQRVNSNLDIPVTLIYSSNIGHVFKAELDDLAASYPEFKIFYFNQRANAEQIAKVSPPKQSLFYISGPSQMVDDLSASLVKNYSLTEAQLIRDWFTGYSR